MNILGMIKKHTTGLLCIAASSGVIITAVLTAKNTPKAIELLKKAEEEKEEKLSVPEKIKIAAPAYIPAIVSGTMTIACLLSSHFLSRRHQMSIASAYGIISSQYKRYSQKVRELCGEDVHKTVMDSISAEKTNVTAQTLFGNYSLEPKGVKDKTLLFYEPCSERYFESTLSQVLQAEYYLNRDYSIGGNVTLNDFYLFLGIDKTDEGDELGWFCDNYELPWIDFENLTLENEDGTNYIMISTIFGPEPPYSYEDERCA